MPTHISITERLANEYTKALVHNPKDTVWANMERAVIGNPHIVKAVDNHAALCGALKKFIKAAKNPLENDNLLEAVTVAKHVLAKARGES